MAFISDYFTAHYGEYKKPFGELNKGETSFISSCDSENGVVGFFDLKPMEKNVITVARTGSVGSSFYHPYKCVVNSDCIVLVPIKSLSREQMLHFVVLLRANQYRYSYARKVTPTRVLETKIPKLGAVFSPVFNLEKKIKELSQPFSSQKHSLADRKWQWFTLQELFEFKKGKRLTKENMIEGKTPFIGSTELENGVTAHISELPIHRGNTISITYNGSVGEAFYQFKDFWASDDVNVLYPRFELNTHRALFLTTIIRQEKYRFNYGRKWHLERMRQSKIKLPVDSDSQPDWQFMEDYIKSLPYSAKI